MKKLTTTMVTGACLFAAAAVSYGQGQVQFQNSTASSAVTFNGGANNGGRIFGAAGTYEYGLYIGAAGASSLSQMTLFDTAQNLAATSSTSALAGLISGGQIGGTSNPDGNAGAFGGTGLTVGQTYTVEVAVWSKSYGADYLTAYNANLAGDGAGWFGLSALGSVVPSGSPSPATQLFGTGAGQLGAFSVSQVPEPTTIALGGLGAAALLLFRRRK